MGYPYFWKHPYVEKKVAKCKTDACNEKHVCILHHRVPILKSYHPKLNAILWTCGFALELNHPGIHPGLTEVKVGPISASPDRIEGMMCFEKTQCFFSAGMKRCFWGYILWTVNFRLFESKWMCNENHKIINHPYLCASSLPKEEVGAEKKGCTQRCMTRAAALLLKRSFHVGSKLGKWDMRMEFGERLMAFRCKNTKLSVKKKKQTKDI